MDSHTHVHVCTSSLSLLPILTFPVITYVIMLEKTDHSAQLHSLQFGPKALLRSQSRDFVISMPQCGTAFLGHADAPAKTTSVLL